MGLLDKVRRSMPPKSPWAYPGDTPPIDDGSPDLVRQADDAGVMSDDFDPDSIMRRLRSGRSQNALQGPQPLAERVRDDATEPPAVSGSEPPAALPVAPHRPSLLRPGEPAPVIPKGNYGPQDAPPVFDSRVRDLSQQMNPPKPSLKQRILKAAMLTAPVALGGIFGGAEGAAGAGEAVSEYIGGQQKREDEQRRTLTQQIDNAQTNASHERTEWMKERTNGPLREAQTRAYESLADQRDRPPAAKTTVDFSDPTHPRTKQWDPDARAYDIDVGAAAPPGAPKVQIDYSDPSHPRLKQYNPQSQTYDIDIGGGKPATPLTPIEQAIEARRKGDMAEYERIVGTNAAMHPKTAPKEPFQVVVDDSGNITGTWYPRSKRFEPAGGTLPPGSRKTGAPAQLQNRDAQAATISKGAEDLIGEVDKIASHLGPGSGRIQKLEQMWGDPDPDVHEFAAHLASWIALQPAFHGFRGLQALQAFDKAVGGIEMTPAALKAGIRGTTKTVHEFQDVRKGNTGKAGDTGNSGEVIDVERGTDGKLHIKKKLTDKVKQ